MPSLQLDMENTLENDDLVMSDLNLLQSYVKTLLKK
jgi:hypothetical protein